jgi:two-component system chemotaxis response regulator CheY
MPDPSDTSGIRVLAVDDSPLMRSTLRFALADAGFDVTEAVNGLDAQHFLAASAFDVLVTDVQMPEQDGLELIRWVRREELDVAVVVMSGGGDLGDRQTLGPHVVLRKPFTPDALAAAVRRALEDRR